MRPTPEFRSLVGRWNATLPPGLKALEEHGWRRLRPGQKFYRRMERSGLVLHRGGDHWVPVRAFVAARELCHVAASRRRIRDLLRAGPGPELDAVVAFAALIKGQL